MASRGVMKRKRVTIKALALVGCCV
ncbi:hypothetical protein OIU79_003264 [Salix purpurea]|uniref:Uncharacterized protein n=1 Tax=Salix purpurea TaxID=77065 RepID=A0A9Q0UL21_SALPP|nr:hypothetical protein OIU79_003264 [Salix purpurea]